MTIHCTAVITCTNLIGDFSGYGIVWYYPEGIANILSLARVRKADFKVTYSSQEGNVFEVTRSNERTRISKESEKGLFYFDTSLYAKQDAVFITTLEDKQYKYTNRDYLQAKLARNIQKIIGRPSTQQF
jgi:hypothetical protein